MPATTAEVRQPPAHPVTVIRAAVSWARAAGIRVRLGSWGVRCVSSYAAERWERDPDASGVDPLGAAVLHAQPMATEVHAAACEAVNAPASWLHGFIEAMDGEQPARRWTESVHRALYAAGYDAGTKYRHEFTRTRSAVIQ